MALWHDVTTLEYEVAYDDYRDSDMCCVAGFNTGSLRGAVYALGVSR
ncbi:hypothetical protein PI125_g22745 [Phytophthora idaei]|nr:hypothetical protein PI125_g22745 [Phytophthora idaei]